VSRPRGDRVLSRKQGLKGRHLPSLTEVIHWAKLPMENASEVPREPSRHVTSLTRLIVGHKVTENWVQKGQDAKGEGYEDRAKAAWVKLHAVSIHSASGGQ